MTFLKEQKIIFLDIDGVLNQYNRKHINEDFNKENVRNLNILIKKTGALIVISSDWKYNMINLFEKWPSHILPMYIDSTRKTLTDGFGIEKEGTEEGRVFEIKEWINYYENFQSKKINYVVLDDMDLKINNFIKIKASRGLLLEDVKKAIAILNKKED